MSAVVVVPVLILVWLGALSLGILILFDVPFDSWFTKAPMVLALLAALWLPIGMVISAIRK